MGVMFADRWSSWTTRNDSHHFFTKLDFCHQRNLCLWFQTVGVWFTDLTEEPIVRRDELTVGELSFLFFLIKWKKHFTLLILVAKRDSFLPFGFPLHNLWHYTVLLSYIVLYFTGFWIHSSLSFVQIWNGCNHCVVESMRQNSLD